jgi:hypothetical protein
MWNDVNTRRNLLINYAIENGLDYLNPESWYDQPLEKIMAVQVKIYFTQNILNI